MSCEIGPGKIVLISAKSNGYIVASYTPFHTYKVTIDI